jgi:hypothetical protein
MPDREELEGVLVVPQTVGTGADSNRRWPGVTKLLFVAAAAALVVGSSSPASADWLVLRDGSGIETDGPWKTKGALVVFTLAKGGLASIRLDEVDLEASEKASEAARERARAEELAARREQSAAPAQPAPREAKWVITDADVGHVGEASSEAAAPTGDAADATPTGLVVRQWGHRDLEEGGVTMFGQLENRGLNAATGIDLVISALDDAGAVLAEASATLDATTLLPGQSTRFEAALADVYAFATVDFRTESLALKLEARDQPVEADEDSL